MKKLIISTLMFLVCIGVSLASLDDIRIERVIDESTNSVSYVVTGSSGISSYAGVIVELMPEGYQLANYNGFSYEIAGGYLEMFFNQNSLPTYQWTGSIDGASMNGYFDMVDDCVCGSGAIPSECEYEDWVCTPISSRSIDGETDINGGGSCVPIDCPENSCDQVYDECSMWLNCGVCSVGYSCIDNICVEDACEPDCTNKECGDDNGCNQKCIVDDGCEEDETCSSSGVCEEDEDEECEFYEKLNDDGECEVNIGLLIGIGIGIVALSFLKK